jgi:hypothetical protein
MASSSIPVFLAIASDRASTSSAVTFAAPPVDSSTAAVWFEIFCAFSNSLNA